MKSLPLISLFSTIALTSLCALNAAGQPASHLDETKITQTLQGFVDKGALVGVSALVTIDGKEKSAYAGVPNYKSDALKNITEGHIFHVITYGKGLMWPHGSQVSPEDRWKIAKYVKTLQK